MSRPQSPDKPDELDEPDKADKAAAPGGAAAALSDRPLVPASAARVRPARPYRLVLPVLPVLPARLVLPVLLVLPILLSASLVGGCKVEAGSSSPDSAGAVVDGEAHLDLRTPPTREQLGVEPGADSVSYTRGSGDVTIDVDLRLPEGGRLRAPAIALHAAFSDVIGNEIVVNRVEASLDDAERAVLDGARDLGLDPQRVRSVVAAWRQGERDLATANVFRGGRFGYLGIEVEMRPNGPGGSVLVNYTVSWPVDSDTATPAAPGPPGR